MRGCWENCAARVIRSGGRLRYRWGGLRDASTAAGPQKRAEDERARHSAGQQFCFNPTSNLLLYLGYRQSPFHAQSEEEGRSPGYRDRKTARPAREHFPPSFVLLSSSRDLSMWLRPTLGEGGGWSSAEGQLAWGGLGVGGWGSSRRSALLDPLYFSPLYRGPP